MGNSKNNVFSEKGAIRKLNKQEVINLQSKIAFTIGDKPISSNVISMCSGCTQCGAQYNQQ